MQGLLRWFLIKAAILSFFLLILNQLNIKFPLLTNAQTMSNDYYMLQQKDINNKAPKKPTEQSYSNAIESSSGIVISGFEGFDNNSPLVFSISQTLIDFGTLSPNNPVLRTNTLAVLTGSVYNYSVLSFENHQLASEKGDSIPDTTCDNGSCNEVIAASWSNPLAFGFGYRCDDLIGADCGNGFPDRVFHKQFADASKSKTEQPVLSGIGSYGEKKAQITYKVNISTSQAQSTYSNVITYIAVSGF